MAVKNPQSIDIRDTTMKKIGIAYPTDFVCSLNNTSGGNSFSFSLPLSYGLIDVGSFVSYSMTDFGGQITARDIDIGRKRVSYSGKSWRGLLENYVVEIGTKDRTLTIESEISHPGCQTMLSGTTSGGIAYPNNGPYPLLHYNFEHFNLPFEVEESEYLIDLPEHYILPVTVPLGTTLAELVDIIESKIGYTVKIDYHADEPNRVLSFRLAYQNIFTDYAGFNPMFGYDEDKLIISEENRVNALFQRAAMYYIADDNEYKSKSNVMSAGYPADLKYDGMSQVAYWAGDSQANSTYNEDWKTVLKRMREGNAKGQISSEVTMPFDPESKTGISWVEIGDIVEYHSRKVDTGFKQVLTGKTLKLVGGVPFITYSFGG